MNNSVTVDFSVLSLIPKIAESMDILEEMIWNYHGKSWIELESLKNIYQGYFIRSN